MHGLVVHHPNDVMPKSKEARRRLKIVVNSLFMYIPDASLIYDIFSWNVMISYYSEDVTYSKTDFVFDELFFITHGGTSKTSKGINISEDIFTGFFKLVKAVMLV